MAELVKLIKRIEKYGKEQKPKEFTLMAEESQVEKLLKDPRISKSGSQRPTPEAEDKDEEAK